MPEHKDNNSVSKKSQMTHKGKEEHKQPAAAEPSDQLETEIITHTIKNWWWVTLILSI